MKLIIGLGNPEDKYRKTRHNFGAGLIDYIASEAGVNLQSKNKLQSMVAEVKISGEKVILAKTLVYMNESGLSASKLKQFYKVKPVDIVVVHDDLDLEFGTVRIKKDGGSAGHHGIESIAAAITPDFWRIRMGIGNSGNTVKYVLGRFTMSEVKKLDSIFSATHQHLEKVLRKGLENFTIR